MFNDHNGYDEQLDIEQMGYHSSIGYFKLTPITNSKPIIQNYNPDKTFKKFYKQTCSQLFKPNN
jgi:hypothetical protein